MNYYAVTQTHYGAEYKWIYSEETLARDIDKYFNDDVAIPKEDEIYYWPIGGSNSSPSHILMLDSYEEIYEFLTAPGDGVDLDDPPLSEIAGYYCEAMCDDRQYNSLTEYFMNEFGLSVEDTHSEDPYYDPARKMIAVLREAGYEDFDYENPFYGKNADMRYSELCELYGKAVKTAQ